MRWDEPCSTITRGFGSTGQGRFMHPSAYPGRTLTPHEAARVQTFPDWFDFGGHLRGTMSKTIGNAVPPLIGEVIGNQIVKHIRNQIDDSKADQARDIIICSSNSGETEIEIAIHGRDKMEREIAKTYPEAEYMDTWVWFQSGINTDGAHNPKTSRKLKSGDILSLNTFPMISGYYTALERTLFLNEINDASLKAWEANITVHKKGLELIKPGAKCSEICKELNDLFAQLGYLQYRTFGYGHSFGVLSHFYGRESGLELREDIHTVLEPNMVISMEPMIMIPEGKPGAGGYREHDILVIKENGAENITKFPFGPEHNIVKN